MSRRVVVRSVARADLEHYFWFIWESSPDAASRFLTAANTTFDRIAAWPGMGRPRERADISHLGIRSFPIDGFPNHLVFYRVPDDESVRILRVRHGAMDLNAVPMPDEE